MGHRAGRHSVGEKRRISRALPALAAFGMAVLLCFFANPVLAGENITYDGETGSEPIIWTDGDYGYTYATLGTTGSDSGNSNSISGNTVTVKNVVVSPPEQLPGNHQYPLKSITVVGANNSTDSNPVTGNTVIIENSEFDHDGSFGYTLDDPNQDYLYSTVYGGAAGPEYAISGHFVSSPISDYNANPSANNNQVKVQHSIIEVMPPLVEKIPLVTI